jgi:hypothetical protein
MVKLRWEEPPSPDAPKRKQGDKRKIDREVAALRRNPGKWALVREDAASGNYITYKKRGCITRTRALGNNRYAIYAKWEPTSPEAQEWMRKFRPEELEAMGIEMPEDEELDELEDDDDE